MGVSTIQNADDGEMNGGMVQKKKGKSNLSEREK